MNNGNVFFTSSLEYNIGSWWHPPSLFMEWAPVFLISPASFTPLAVQSVSPVRIVHTYAHGATERKYGVREKEYKRNVKTLEKKYTWARKKDSLLEVHPLAIMDHATKENHSIDWKAVKFPARDTDWTARGVKEAVKIRKTRAHSINRDGGCQQLPTLSSKLLVKKTSAFINSAIYQHSDDAKPSLATLIYKY